MASRCALIFVFWLSVAGLTQAATVSISPSNTLSAVGGNFTVDVSVSGLTATEAIGAYDLDVIFNSTILSASQVIFAPSLGVDGVDQISNAVLSAGRIDFSSVSLLSEAALFALQAGTFTIAQLVFDSIGPGTSTIAFDLVTAPGLLFGDQFGNPLALSVDTQASATIVGPFAVPEPVSLALVLAALGALFTTTTARRRL